MRRMLKPSYGELPLPYQTYLPKGSANPGTILVYLHGSGERGVSPEELDEAWGLPRVLAAGLELPIPVVSPVCPAGDLWRPELIRMFLEGLRSHPATAQSRLVLCGYSMGGTGIYAYLSEPRTEAAAGIVVAGRIGIFSPEGLARFPLLAIYGDSDERFSGSRVPDRLAEIREAGGNVHLKVLPSAGHYITEEAFASPEFTAWITAVTDNEGGIDGSDHR